MTKANRVQFLDLSKKGKASHSKCNPCIRQNLYAQKKHVALGKSVRAHSQIPVFGLTGSAPGWPGALKLHSRIAAV